MQAAGLGQVLPNTQEGMGTAQGLAATCPILPPRAPSLQYVCALGSLTADSLILLGSLLGTAQFGAAGMQGVLWAVGLEKPCCIGLEEGGKWIFCVDFLVPSKHRGHAPCAFGKLMSQWSRPLFLIWSKLTDNSEQTDGHTKICASSCRDALIHCLSWGHALLGPRLFNLVCLWHRDFSGMKTPALWQLWEMHRPRGQVALVSALRGVAL